MEKGQILELYIEDMSSDGNGIGKTDGQVVFVDGCVLGDKVKAKVTKAKKNYAFADCLKILEPSDKRNEGFCQFSKDCGGSLQNPFPLSSRTRSYMTTSTRWTSE